MPFLVASLTGVAFYAKITITLFLNANILNILRFHLNIY